MSAALPIRPIDGRRLCQVSARSLFCPSVLRLAAYGEQVDGTPFGRYRLIEQLGHRGMGEVWRAHDTEIDGWSR